MDTIRDDASASTPRHRRSWTEEEKAVTLGLLAESDMSVAEFARTMDLSEATLHAWRRHAREGDPMHGQTADPGQAVQFAAVQVVRGESDRWGSLDREDDGGVPSAVQAAVPSGLTMAVRWPTGIVAQITGLDTSTIDAVLRALAIRGGPPCCP